MGEGLGESPRDRQKGLILRRKDKHRLEGVRARN